MKDEEYKKVEALASRVQTEGDCSHEEAVSRMFTLYALVGAARLSDQLIEYQLERKRRELLK